MTRRWFKRVGDDFVEVMRPGRWTIGDVQQVAGRLTDERIWKELALGLLINRHCAEYIDDDTVSRELRRAWVSHRRHLPWSIP
jgi:hypothetical protein